MKLIARESHVQNVQNKTRIGICQGITCTHLTIPNGFHSKSASGQEWSRQISSDLRQESPITVPNRKSPISREGGLLSWTLECQSGLFPGIFSRVQDSARSANLFSKNSFPSPKGPPIETEAKLEALSRTCSLPRCHGAVLKKTGNVIKP